MLKKLASAAALGVVGIAMTGCLSVPVMPPQGILFNDYYAPLDFDQQESSVGMRSGEASTMSVLGLVAMGDASIDTAARNGGITTIHGADYHYFNVLGVYQTYTTIVRGE